MATTNNGLDLSRNVEASDEGREESASDVFVKFLMSQNISVDVNKDSNFQMLLRRVAQQGNQSCLFLENSTVIQNSLWRYEHEIKEYMRIVMGSWKSTGCTLMSYNVKGPQQNNRVLGFYCPKGFIFLEGGQSEQQVWNALADLVPGSRYYDFSNSIVRFVRHDCSYHSKCQYQALDVTGTAQYSLYYTDIKCIRQQVHVFWRSICKTSKWVQRLIEKSDEVFECIVTSDLSEVFYNTLKQKGVERLVGWKNASSFARLRMVMKVKSELTDWLSHLHKYDVFHLQNETNVTAIINNSEFWSDGSQLVRVLTPFYEIPSLMDTLVPTAGYLELAIDKASGLLKTYSESEPLKYKQIWECFKIWSDDCVELSQDLARYLNPCYYILGQDEKEDIAGDSLPCLYGLAGTDEEEDEEAVDAEIDAYTTKSSNPFAGVSVSEFEANHPSKSTNNIVDYLNVFSASIPDFVALNNVTVTLWSKYGGGFPLLQKCAYILLSQPACCLCKQVEKQVSKLGGSDNFMLRLNGLMMEEFTKLGDQIYQPIHI